MRNSTLQSQNCRNFARTCQKTTQALLFLIRTEFSFFFDLELIIFRLFLTLFFVAETDVVPNLQRWAQITFYQKCSATKRRDLFKQ